MSADYQEGVYRVVDDGSAMVPRSTSLKDYDPNVISFPNSSRPDSTAGALGVVVGGSLLVGTAAWFSVIPLAYAGTGMLVASGGVLFVKIAHSALKSALNVRIGEQAINIPTQSAMSEPAPRRSGLLQFFGGGGGPSSSTTFAPRYHQENHDRHDKNHSDHHNPKADGHVILGKKTIVNGDETHIHNHKESPLKYVLGLVVIGLLGLASVTGGNSSEKTGSVPQRQPVTDPKDRTSQIINLSGNVPSQQCNLKALTDSLVNPAFGRQVCGPLPPGCGIPELKGVIATVSGPTRTGFNVEQAGSGVCVTGIPQ